LEVGKIPPNEKICIEREYQRKGRSSKTRNRRAAKSVIVFPKKGLNEKTERGAKGGAKASTLGV